MTSLAQGHTWLVRIKTHACFLQGSYLPSLLPTISQGPELGEEGAVEGRPCRPPPLVKFIQPPHRLSVSSGLGDGGPMVGNEASRHHGREGGGSSPVFLMAELPHCLG